ncbi:patatin-like phospholipase family protein [uncultured Dokdonia sp.]|uniref:patatin-like phospholipase family protein n=1 Tax=uncultured Dokdonia sp. TaxID=575653 RepID=UPI002616CCD2|nr:patatin-like phospholipase family protein [uncultured Dokdonia sp.]
MKLKLTFLFLFAVLSLSAQVGNEKDVKVGLVLSGGGAKGLAHVGVLKVLEEAGVKIDYIAGTSMGAIVGGLYASGYSATQLDSLFRAVDFDKVIQDELPRKAKTFYEKEASEKYAISLPFDSFKLSLPQSISKGQNTYNLLIRLLEHVNGIDDFTQLPIPFFCVATDIEKAEQVILDTGFLPEAISSSGALPTLFKPVTLGDRMLIDGGVLNNYPVNELRAKGVDVIIGVDVQDGLRERDQLTTAPDIFLQINNYRTIKEMEGKRDSTDVYIRPDIKDFSVVDFDQANVIIDRGETEALKQFDALKDIAMRQGTLSRKRMKEPKLKDSIKIDAVVIRGNKDYTRSYILGKLQLDLPVTLDYERFSNGINNLAATANFDRIGHRFDKIPEGTLLNIDVQESKSKQSIGLGLHYDDLYRSAALVNYTRKRILFDNDIATFDLIIGDNIRYAFNYYIDKGYYWSVGIRSTYNTFNKGVSARLVEEVSNADLAGLSRVTLDYQDLTNQIYLQTLFVKQFSLDLGIQHKFLDVETETVDDDDDIPGSVFEKSNFFGAYGQLRYDSLDNRYFPKSGVYFDGDFDLNLYSSDFNDNFTEFSIANAYFLYAASIAKKWTFLTELSGGFKIGGEDVRSLDFFLGGYGNKKINNLVPFYGYDFISIAGDGYVKAGFSVDFEFLKKNHFNIGVNVANAGYNLFTSEEWLTRPDFTGYALGYGMDTFLGPLELKYTYSPEIKTGEWFIAIGFQF